MADRVDTMLRNERELMAGISHELRTPLTRLQLELALLEDRAPERVESMRGDASRDRKTGGSGLGLMIVRQVVELHGGEVRAENRAEGACA